MVSSNAPEAQEQVLSTLNRDGSRRWIRPKRSPGRYHRRRFMLGWALILVFNLLPILRLKGKPLMLLDVQQRQFTFFGATFLPTDTFLLMLLLFSIFVSIFLVTALWGRLWCGWACPQTVYMEFLFRPLEQWLEGGRQRQLKLDREGPDGRRLLKHVLFFLVAAWLANTFLAYFVGWDRLMLWMTQLPTRHPGPFLVMLVTTLLMYIDFGWFREQTCIVACPYGRFQSVLLDRQSMIVGYDAGRGEPRGPLRADTAVPRGDCIDCGLCVSTCPTGIDIRDGLQMECVHCTQCMDACDAVMDRIDRPRGLIRYTSEDELEHGERKLLRPRLVVYSTLILLVFGGLVVSLAGRSPADVTLLRGLGSPFTVLADGSISNQVRLKITNRTERDQSYRFELVDGSDLELVAPENPLEVPVGSTLMTAAFINAPPELFHDGEAVAVLRISDGGGLDVRREFRLLGPAAAGEFSP